jgi:hypothetical protein
VSIGRSPPIAARMRATWASDSPTDIRTFRWLYASEADTVSVRASTPVAAASSAPFTLGTRAR